MLMSPMPAIRIHLLSAFCLVSAQLLPAGEDGGVAAKRQLLLLMCAAQSPTSAGASYPQTAPYRIPRDYSEFFEILSSRYEILLTTSASDVSASNGQAPPVVIVLARPLTDDERHQLQLFLKGGKNPTLLLFQQYETRADLDDAGALRGGKFSLVCGDAPSVLESVGVRVGDGLVIDPKNTEEAIVYHRRTDSAVFYSAPWNATAVAPETDSPLGFWDASPLFHDVGGETKVPSAEASGAVFTSLVKASTTARFLSLKETKEVTLAGVAALDKEAPRELPLVLQICTRAQGSARRVILVGTTRVVRAYAMESSPVPAKFVIQLLASMESPAPSTRSEPSPGFASPPSPERTGRSADLPSRGEQTDDRNRQ